MSQGPGPRFIRIALLACLTFACGASSPPSAAPPRAEESGAPFDAPLAGPPLAPPLDLTGGFCEYRIGHFHAGFDLGTGQRVGKPVLAPARGHVARIRSSGVGYGRSIYLATDDGRLLQFGHLDAFAEPLASYVRSIQDSSGQYEQDLWPEANRFRFEPGAVIAWTGESGAGGPHLHFEIRRNDMAYHPSRAGLAVRDSAPPSLASLTLEPLDGASFVEGSAAPVTRRLGARPETLRVIGRMRAVVAARDGVWRGVDRMVPWSVGQEWEGQRVECRFDSVSWATDMAEGDMVYDAGRVVGEKGVTLWAPAGFRPRVMVADAPLDEDAGTIVVRSGDPPRALRLWARDLGGNRVDRNVVLLAGSRPDTGRSGGRGSGGRRLRFASLPGGFLRVTDRHVPAGSSRVRAVLGTGRGTVGATGNDQGYSAVLPLGETVSREARRLTIGTEGAGAKSPWLAVESMLAVRATPGDSTTLEPEGFRVRVAAGATFEPVVLLARSDEANGASGELRGGSGLLVLEPEGLPLRRPIRIGIPAATPARRDAALYRRTGDGWDWIGGSFDSARGEFAAESRRLGQFALMRDTLAPRVTLRRPPKSAATRPYSRWALEATVNEAGSGVDARATYFVVDGKRVATEWDSEERTLRWRPAKRPAAGRHRVTIVAADRAGNTRRVPATYVLD